MAKTSNVQILTPDELRDLFVLLLSGATGRPAHYWRRVVGEVRKLPIALNAHSNWTIVPAGKPVDLEAVAKAEAIMRAAHPYVARERSAIRDK